MAKEKSDQETNILLIMTDQQHFDAPSSYGNKAINTPNIDRLAEEGIRFEIL
ncbi:MAG: sulfatase-like hydrolase/transferase [Bacteroidales bacterium]